MLVEQVLHIMLNQDYSRSLCYFRPQMYELLHYAIFGKMENMGKSYANVCIAIASAL